MENKYMQNKKKHSYRKLDYTASRQRSCYTIGKVYVYNDNNNNNRGFLKNDLLLCIKKCGDCCYDFIRIEKTTETQYNGIPSYQLEAYFSLHNKIMCYGGMMEAFPNMEALSKLDLVHVLYSKQVLIPLIVTLSDIDLKILYEKWELQKKLYNYM